MAPETAPRSAPLALWREARAFLDRLFMVFCGPRELAARQAVDAREHRLIAAWLRAGECILRQLLLVEAAAAPAPPESLPEPRREPAPRERMPPKHAARAETPIDDPQAWRVSFICFASHCGGAGACWRERKCAERLRATLPLALRMEALLRVFNDPAPFALRLRRRLARRPHRAKDLLREPPESNLSAAPRAAGEIVDLLPAAYVAWARLDTG